MESERPKLGDEYIKIKNLLETKKTEIENATKKAEADKIAENQRVKEELKTFAKETKYDQFGGQEKPKSTVDAQGKIKTANEINQQINKTLGRQPKVGEKYTLEGQNYVYTYNTNTRMGM